MPDETDANEANVDETGADTTGADKADADVPETYTPRRTHHLSVKQKAPHGPMRTLTYTLRAGQTYRVVTADEAEEVLGHAPVSNVPNPALVRADCLPDHAQ
jgi:hypothetical protein